MCPGSESAVAGGTRVSVVIPLYNRREYIDRAVRSVLAQTYTDFELVVVDDGSVDGGGEVVRGCSDRRVRLITQPNGGECAARNRGVAEARTRWVAFLDSDDEWRPEFLDRTMSMIESHPHVAAVFTNLICNGSCRSITRPYPAGVLDDYFQFVVDNEGHAASSTSVVVHKPTLCAAGGFPAGVRHGGDIDTWARLAWLGEMAYVPEALAVWHTEAENRVLKDPAAKITDAPLTAIASYERWKQEGRIPEKLLRSSARMAQFLYLQHVLMLCQAGQRARARRVLRQKCVPKLCGRRAYLREFLRTILPPGLTECLRAWRGLGSGTS